MASVPGPLFFSPEGTRGVEEAETATDLIQYISCDWTCNGDGQERGVIGDFSDMAIAAPPQGLFWSGNLVTEIKASADGIAAPEIGPLLEGSGWTKAGLVYTLNPQLNLPAALKSGTLFHQFEPVGEGNLYVSPGVTFGGVTYELSMDASARATWPWMGQYKKPVDLAALTAGTPHGGTALNLLTTFNFHAYGALVRSCTLNMPRTQTARPSAAAASTFRYVWPAALGVQQITGSMVIEEVDQTAFDMWTKFGAGTSSTGTIVLSAGARTLTIALTGVTFGTPAQTQGVPNTITLPFRCGGEGCVTQTWA